MADPAGLILAYFAEQQPSLQLPDDSWVGIRPRDDVHDLESVRFDGERLEMVLANELVRRTSGPITLKVVRPGEVRRTTERGTEDLIIGGFESCTMDSPAGHFEWTGGRLRFVGFNAYP